jgi:uncharacterized protein YyaL (SSP411 family)
MSSRRTILPPPEVIRALPPDGGPEFNRLIHETSPYLLQHARNPVDWYPWGPEALARAAAEDKSIFLSVGYSSCHWCHVMEHESFERDDVAEILNANFVCIKVDREERPDLDDLYMTATQLMTGRGGWPNSLWLMPDGRPWYAGTYFPREDRAGQPGFKTLLLRLAEVWTTRRADVEEQARQLAAAIRRNAEGPGPALTAAATAAELLAGALHQFEESYDPQHGGFGGAPKFPPHTALALMLDLRDDLAARARPLVIGTLDAMRRGGIHDHVGGGFHRYSTDGRWLVPHFEKMLYDNAQLARNYAAASALTGNAVYRATACDTLDWVLRDMTGPEGGFYSALDADSDGEEGRFYVWSHEQILEILGPDDGARFCRAYNISPKGNFHDEATGRPTGLNIPHLSDTPDAPEPETRARLLEERRKRVWPQLDDKVLTGWNGLMLGAFAFAGKAFGEPRYIAAAERAARFFLTRMMPGGRLMRVWRNGEARIPAFLEDFAALADGLLDLHEATGQAEWLDAVRRLASDFSGRFVDPQTGGFFSTADDHDVLLARGRDTFDQAMPSSTSLAIRVLARLAAHTGDASWRETARRALGAVAPLMQRHPTGAAALIRAALLLETVTKGPSYTRPEMPSAPAPVQVVLEHKTRSVKPGQEVDLVIRLNVAPGWRATHVTVRVAGDFSATEPRKPEGPPEFRGHNAIPCRLRAAEVLPEKFAVARLTVAWQPCDDTACRAPERSEQEIVFRVA